MKSLQKLFSPITINSMKLKNRIAMAPMATNYANPDGSISERYKAYIEARARGGAALIILEVTSIDASFPYVQHTVGLWDDKLIPGMRQLADAVHAHGSRVVPQISHPGPESVSFFRGIQPVGPSVILSHSHKQICRELSVAEIEHIIEQFGDAARRAREAGCDGLELHAAHSYMLLGSFISSLRNRRTDAYGGSIEDRLKLPIEVIKNIRAKAGSDFPIIMRLSGDELTPGGRNLEETQYIAPILAKAGVDAFHISSGTFPQMSWRILPPTGTPRGLNVAFSAAIKEVVDIPVMVVGRINDPRLAEDILRRNQADVIVMGRALLADPDLPNKAAEGRFDDIAPCIACGLGCIAGRAEGRLMTCVINPTVGREREMIITPAAKPKKVMVVGAGPGGLEAARVAALRGHKVTLYEKEAEPGGQLRLAAVPPMKQELSKSIKYLRTQAEKAGVTMQWNARVTPELVAKVKPDVVIVASGAESLVPNIPGVKGDKVVSAHDVLAGKVFVQCGNVLVLGGGMVGLETAEFLASPGDNPVIGRTRVTVVEMLDDVGQDMVPEGRTLLMQRLRESGVEILTCTKVKEIFEDGVVTVNTIKETLSDGTVVLKDGQVQQTICGMDIIILALGAKSVDELSQKIKDKVAEVYVIGDAKQPRKALEAIAEGSEIGRKI